MVAAPPVVVASRGEIWFGGYFTGLRVVRFPKSVYPFKDSLTCSNDYYFNQYNPGLCPDAKPSPRDCLHATAPVTIASAAWATRRVRSVTVSVNGKRVRVLTGSKRSIRVRLSDVRKDAPM